MMTNTPTTSQMTRAEVNRRMVAGELTPTAARDATIDLYRADPAAAARLVAPDEERGEPWDATAPDLSPKVERPPRAPGVGRRAAVVTSTDLDQGVVSDEPAPAPTTLGAYLAMAREEKGLTRTQLGSAIGARSDIIKAYEDGRRRPSSFMAPRLAEALDVDPDFLRVLVEEQDRPRTTSRRGTRRTAASTSKGAGKTRGKAASPRTTATRKRARIVTDQTAPMTLPTTTPATATTIDTTPATATTIDTTPALVTVPSVLPRLAWQDARYRIVQLRENTPTSCDDDDDEDGMGMRPYVIEREDGRDALGTMRWQQIGAGDEGAWRRATQHLMRVLAENGAAQASRGLQS